jgi:hypothetical protein
MVSLRAVAVQAIESLGTELPLWGVSPRFNPHAPESGALLPRRFWNLPLTL